MDAVRFSTLAPLLGAYPGAIAARYAKEHAEAEQGVVSVAEPRPAPAAPPLPVSPMIQRQPNGRPGAQIVEASPIALSMSPIGDMFSFSKVSGG